MHQAIVPITMLLLVVYLKYNAGDVIYIDDAKYYLLLGRATPLTFTEARELCGTERSLPSNQPFFSTVYVLLI